MRQDLSERSIAVLATNGVEQLEIVESPRLLRAAGAFVEVVSLKKDVVSAWDNMDWGEEFAVDRHISAAEPAAYDALLVPGGVINVDFLRLDERAVRFVREFGTSGRPTAAIGHGPWMFIETGLARGRRLTSYLSLKADLLNAGATWIDEPVVVDGNIITARRASDIAALCEALAEALSRGRRAMSASVPAG